MFNLERVARAEDEIDRVGGEGAQKESQRLKDGPSHQKNSLS